MKVHVDYGPDTNIERQAKERLYELQLEYQRRAQPYINILVEAQSIKMPRIYYVPEPGDKPVGFA